MVMLEKIALGCWKNGLGKRKKTGKTLNDLVRAALHNPDFSLFPNFQKNFSASRLALVLASGLSSRCSHFVIALAFHFPAFQGAADWSATPISPRKDPALTTTSSDLPNVAPSLIRGVSRIAHVHASEGRGHAQAPSSTLQTPILVGVGTAGVEGLGRLAAADRARCEGGNA
jgi:hypothetical protein